MTLAEIKQIITNTYISFPEVAAIYGLEEGKTFEEQFSVASLESLIFDATAVGIQTSTKEFIQLKSDILAELKKWRPQRPNWYAEKAKLFQYGMELSGDTDDYDNAGLTADQITAMQVVKYAAAYDAHDKSVTYLKIATGTEGNRSPLSAAQLIAFTSYIYRVAGAGVHFEIINDLADALKLEADIYYNPLILDKDGKMLDGTNDTPVQDAANGYVDSLEFNGTYVNMTAIDKIQAVTGVRIAEIKEAAYRYGTYQDWRKIMAFQVAHSGYFKIDPANLKLNFIPYE